ncbi:alpha/beta fold hydrolase [Nonomuraea sp. AD125B]|uniref:alpha/beta hydrolase family protein n=1 Tax=Nonomuraea TaxID=83681 RepID=UPI0031D49C02
MGARRPPLPFRAALRVRGALPLLGLRRGEPLLPRLVFMGADPGEALDALRAIRSPGAWCSVWERLAERHERTGRALAADGDRVTAAESLQRAVACYRAAEYMEFQPAERARLWRRLVAAGTAAGDLLSPPARRLEIPVDGVAVPVTLRVPAGGRPAPCVLTLGGVDGVKEEFHRISEAYVARGWAAAALDLPGQGELRRFHDVPWRADAEVVISTVLDALTRLPDLDADRIAVVGGSAGGYFALRAAAADRRVAACAVISAPLDLLEVHRVAPPPIPQTMEYNLGLSGRRAVAALGAFHVDEVLPGISCPVLQIHGGADRTVPWPHARRLREALGERLTVLFLEDGDHMCFNRLPEWEARLRSWLSTVLDGRGAAEVPARSLSGEGAA